MICRSTANSFQQGGLPAIDTHHINPTARSKRKAVSRQSCSGGNSQSLNWTQSHQPQFHMGHDPAHPLKSDHTRMVRMRHSCIYTVISGAANTCSDSLVIHAIGYDQSTWSPRLLPRLRRAPTIAGQTTGFDRNVRNPLQCIFPSPSQAMPEFWFWSKHSCHCQP
jgi:hypothetical protein